MARVSAVFFGEHSSGFRSDVKVQSRFKGNPTPLREGLNGGEGGRGGAWGSTYRLSVIIQFGSRSVKIFDLCRLSVNLS